MTIGTDGFFVRPLPSIATLAEVEESQVDAELLPTDELLKDERIRRMLCN